MDRQVVEGGRRGWWCLYIRGLFIAGSRYGTGWKLPLLIISHDPCHMQLSLAELLAFDA
jgi:hypothetical protein